MSKELRERQHQERLARMSSTRITNADTGRGSEATFRLQVEIIESELRGHKATEKGCDAFERLLSIAERSDTGQARGVALILAAVWGARPLDPMELRSLDVGIGDDCLSLLDAVRWARIPVSAMAEDAEARMAVMLHSWGLAG